MTGAAAVVRMSVWRRRIASQPARIVSWATAGVDPKIMGSGPILPAALEKAGRKIGTST
jgi:acetyl-CoA C-acetyltransferase